MNRSDLIASAKAAAADAKVDKATQQILADLAAQVEADTPPEPKPKAKRAWLVCFDNGRGWAFDDRKKAEAFLIGQQNRTTRKLEIRERR